MQAPPEHSEHQPKASVLDVVPPEESHEELQLPRYSTRGTAPGLRGCWATNRQGEPCGAARRADSDYCNAHSGYGVAENPGRYAALGGATLRRRAAIRATLGITRSSTPRGVLKAAVHAESERLALAALDGALNSELSPAVRASHALKLIDAVDPLTQVSTLVELPDNAEGVESLSLSQLLCIAEQHQIDIVQP
jgi:hypothetical protein